MLQQRTRSSATGATTPDPPPSEPAHRRRRPRRRTVVVGGIAVLLVAALVVYLAVLRPRAAAQDTATPATTTTEVSTATFEKSVTTTGTLTPAVQEDVSFAASGTVQSVAVEAGDTVAKGDTLATIDTLQLDAALASARSDLADAEAELADAQESDDGTDAATSRIEAREAAVAVAQQSADDAEAAMDDATLVAPAAGLVTTVGVAVGDTVSGGSTSSGATSGGSPDAGSGSGTTGGTGSSTTTSSTSAFMIVGTDAWTVDVSVGESDVANLAEGDQVEMTSDDLTDTVFGTVSEIGRLPSTTQGAVAYPVTITVTGEPDGLYDGVSVDVSIVYERRTDVLSVPAAAVSTDTDGQSVVSLVGDDGTTTETVVETGDTSGSSIEIVSGLAEGDTVSYTAFTPRGGQTGEDGGAGQQGGTGQQGGLPEGFDPSQLPGGGQGGPGGQGGGGQGGIPGQGGNS